MCIRDRVRNELVTNLSLLLDLALRDARVEQAKAPDDEAAEEDAEEDDEHHQAGDERVELVVLLVDDLELLEPLVHLDLVADGEEDEPEDADECEQQAAHHVEVRQILDAPPPSWL